MAPPQTNSNFQPPSAGALSYLLQFTFIAIPSKTDSFSSESGPTQRYCVPMTVPPPPTCSSSQRPAARLGAPRAGAFAGGWQIVTNANERYTLVLSIANGGMNPMQYDMQVTGQLISSDGATQKNGVVKGVIPKGTPNLIYSFAQPGINAAGQGQFVLSNEGNAITGSGTAGGQTFTWAGTRAR